MLSTIINTTKYKKQTLQNKLHKLNYIYCMWQHSTTWVIILFLAKYKSMQYNFNRNHPIVL
jgi:hypothetical protein